MKRKICVVKCNEGVTFLNEMNEMQSEWRVEYVTSETLALMRCMVE